MCVFMHINFCKRKEYRSPGEFREVQSPIEAHRAGAIPPLNIYTLVKTSNYTLLRKIA